MKLSAPVYTLKQQAKALARQEQLALHEALDQIARREGFTAWSLLSAQLKAAQPAAKLLSQLRAGELVLLAGRPGEGKTLLGLELAAEAIKGGRAAAFFTLEFTAQQVATRFEAMAHDRLSAADPLLVEDSDDISADFVVERLASASPRTLIVIDYLQLLDQKREKPDLMTQVRQLREFARLHEHTIVCLSQIHRSYDAEAKDCPDLSDVRLPNPLDLTLFDHACFINQGQVRLSATGV